MGETFLDGICRLAYILYKVFNIYINGNQLPGPRTVSQLKRSVLHPSTTSNYICRFQPPNNADSFLNARLGSGYYSGDQQEKLEISCVEASLPGSSLATYDIDNAFHGVTEKVCLPKSI